MARRPKPWFREGRDWFVQIEGKQHSLGRDKNDAFRRFHELMSKPKTPAVTDEHVACILDLFLEWTKSHRATTTYEWYRKRLQWFLKSIPPSARVGQLRPYNVQQWLDAHPNWSDTHKRGCIIAVQRAFTWATKMGYLQVSPFVHIEKPSATQRDVVNAKREFEQILAHVRDEEFRDLLIVSWEIGCRPQESLVVEVAMLTSRTLVGCFLRRNPRARSVLESST